MKLPEWDFSKYYAGTDDPAIREKMNRAFNMAQEFQDDYKGMVSGGELSADKLKIMLERIEEIMEIAYPISMYSSLLTVISRSFLDFQLAI